MAEMAQRRIRATVEYLGTRYFGFQLQGEAPTIELVIRRAIADLERSGGICLHPKQVRLTAASRTDAGVHARGQVICFSYHGRVPAERIPYALNSRLPEDISVVSAEEADWSFHPRYDARSKRYSYSIFNRRIPSPLKLEQALWVPRDLDAGAMAAAASLFLGTHDFAAFMASGSSVVNTVRTVFRSEVTHTGPEIEYTVEADGFLYNMVRIMAGTLIEVGKGKYGNERVLKALRSRDRKMAGPTARPCGLCLEEVRY